MIMGIPRKGAISVPCIMQLAGQTPRYGQAMINA